MATIIKSDRVAKRHMGSVYPDILPANGLVGFFDFSNDDYKANGSSVQLSSLINVTRSTIAIGLNKDGQEVTYPANTPRFHLVKSNNMYGLASGDLMKNYFLNSGAPSTQTITIEEGTGNKFFLYVQIKGPGKLTLSGGVTGEVTESEPLFIKVAKTITFTATPSGTLTYVQTSKVSSPYGIDISRPATASLMAQKTQDVIQVNRTLFDTFLSAQSEITVFIKMARFDGGNFSLTPQTNFNKVMLIDSAPVSADGGYVSFLDMVDGDNADVYVRKQKSGAVISTSTKRRVKVGDKNVFGLSFNKKQASIIFNGILTSLDEGTDVLPKVNFLPCYTSDASDLMSPNSILTKMVVYNRKLTDDEMRIVHEILK